MCTLISVGATFGSCMTLWVEEHMYKFTEHLHLTFDFPEITSSATLNSIIDFAPIVYYRISYPSSTMADTEYQEEAPSGEVTQDEYTSRTGQKDANVPVQDNNAPIEDPIDPATADSDQQLGMSALNNRMHLALRADSSAFGDTRHYRKLIVYISERRRRCNR